MEERRERRRNLRASRLAAHRRTVAFILFAAIAVLAVLGLVVKDRTFSDDENRSLAQRPALSLDSILDGSFFSDYSSYLSDQFFARDTWISVDTLVTRMLGKHDVNGVYLGANGRLFGTPEEPDTQMLAEKMGAVNDFAWRHEDWNIMFMLVPGSSSILRSRLPGNAPLRDQAADIAMIEDAVDTPIHVVDVTPVLTEHSAEEIYYRTDHHWTSLGAYYAFTTLAPYIDPYAQMPTFEFMRVSNTFEGTLASRSGVHGTKDSVYVCLPQDIVSEYYVNYLDTQTRVTSLFSTAALEQKDQYTVFFGGNHPIVEIWTTVNNGRSLLLFKDSYANSFVQFLTTYYDKIIMIDPRYFYADLGTTINSYGITDVLFLYSGDTWMTDTSLEDVLATG